MSTEMVLAIVTIGFVFVAMFTVAFVIKIIMEAIMNYVAHKNEDRAMLNYYVNL